MAPKPTDYARRAADESAVLRWRVGRSGSLVLSIGRCEDDLASGAPHDCDGLAVRVEFHRCPLVARRSDAAAQPASEVLSGRLRASSDHLEHRLVLSLCRGDSMLDALVSLVERPGGAPLILTDLPIALGLRGGTYKLDAASVERFAAAVQPLLALARG